MIHFQSRARRPFVRDMAVGDGISAWSEEINPPLFFGPGKAELDLRDPIFAPSNLFRCWSFVAPEHIENPARDLAPWPTVETAGSEEMGDGLASIWAALLRG